MKKTVLITGASRGIGAQTALYFAENGFDVAINYLKNDESANEVYKKIVALGRKCCLLKCDVSDNLAVKEMVSQATSFLGGIGVLVNNAAISELKLFSDISFDDWNKMFSVNVGGMYNTIFYVLPQMIHEKCGSIVNVSSIWGICGASCEVHYSASKSAIIGLTKALAKELAPSNIRVNCVSPGVVETEMNKHLSQEDLDALKEETPLGKIGSPRDIAKAIYFLASSELSSFTTGQILSPNGGIVI